MESDGYKIRDQHKIHYLTFTVVHWLDVFTRKRYKDIIIDSLEYCITKKSMIIYGYVIMSNHMHLIIQSGIGDLSGLIRDFKKHTSKQIIKSIQSEPESRREWLLDNMKKATESHTRNKNFQFWKYNNHPEEVYSEKFMWSKLDYIHLNPIRAGIVSKASEYTYSSACNYCGIEGLLSITKVDIPLDTKLNDDAFWKSISW